MGHTQSADEAACSGIRQPGASGLGPQVRQDAACQQRNEQASAPSFRVSGTPKYRQASAHVRGFLIP